MSTRKGAMARALRSGGVLVAAVALFLPAACAEERTPSDDKVPRSDGVPSGEPDDLILPSSALVFLKPDSGASASRSPAGPVTQVGRARTNVSVSSLDGGSIGAVPGREGSGAFRFPRYRPRSPYPRAVIVVTSATPGDALSPGASGFRYGADLRLDAISTGRVEDNGNNVLQRGLSSDRVMFKLEVDANLRPACTVQGTEGSLTVRVDTVVSPGRWYRVFCERRGTRVRMWVAQSLPSGDFTTVAVRARRGPVGSLDFEDSGAPVAVGGKVASNGAVIATSTDQFNGEIANAFLAIRADGQG